MQLIPNFLKPNKGKPGNNIMITFNDMHTNIPFETYKSKTGFVQAKQIAEEFRIKRAKQKPLAYDDGQPDDYLILDDKGELSIISKATFERDYTLID